MSIRAVAFDLDGTLYPAAALNRRAAALCLRHPALFAGFSQMRRELRAIARTEEYRKSPPADGIEFRDMQGTALAHRLRSSESGTKALMYGIFYGRIFECFADIRPFTGVREALAELKALGLPLGLLSDMPPERKLELMGLSDCFDVVRCSEESGFLKPEPESFLSLAQALGREPAEVLYVGNNPRYDLAGARRAGMQAALVSRRPLFGADLCFHRWDDLVRFVKERLGSR